ncbi:hypothetical protein B5M44_25570 [Shinella sumterensis]|jgi:hypothetical protein|uniref:hypothetical protein n=1 Tax=Shinella sumterensis TaxID=1967501 RepID=UPI00106E66E6|nr:hypothetical protein [Shinella sumterensis]MCD1266866.1 hypothetical protein [Shinella sumterensis]TFE93045.1 hypothetical protein B5M44_25570 [Shinella sumterensis]
MNTPSLQHRVNLLDDGLVVTDEGEYLGTWDADDTDAFVRFFPDGAVEYLFLDPFRWGLCNRIEAWHASLSNGE